MLQIKDENELYKLGLRLDDADPSNVIPLHCPSTIEENDTESYITPETVIQLEDLVTKAAKDVERCETAEQVAKDKVDQLETELEEAVESREKTACDRIAAYWTLGRSILDLEKALASNKGKHTENTPRKRAIELAGDPNRYQRAKAIALHFDHQGDAEEAAKWKSFNEIHNDISTPKAEERKEKGQKAPGRRPVKKAVKKEKPKETSKPKTTSTIEDDEEIQPSQEEMEAVLNFVKVVGGWSRAILLIEEVHKKCSENQNG